MPTPPHCSQAPSPYSSHHLIGGKITTGNPTLRGPSVLVASAGCSQAPYVDKVNKLFYFVFHKKGHERCTLPET